MQHALTYPDDLKAIIPISTGARLRVHPKYLAICEEGIKDSDYFMKEYVESDYEHLGDQEIHWIQLEKRREVSQVQLAGDDAGVFLEHLVKVTQAEEKDRVREAGLQLALLPEHGRDFCH